MSVYILSGARTANGAFLGKLSTTPAPRLGAFAINGALEKAQLGADQIDEVFMGNVVTAGVGQAPARQAALFAGFPNSVPCTTVNKVCGSGMKTIIMGAQSILSGDNSTVVAGGMENMSLAPHLLPKSRTGIKFGNGTLIDSMSHDGLWDVYSNQAMGNCAEECSKKYNFTRDSQDEFAKESYLRSQKAIKDGIFAREITPVLIESRKGDVLVDEDEGPFQANFEKMGKLRPAFAKDGAITAANASTINDGAAAVILSSNKENAKFEIIAHASHAQDPTWFTTAPTSAMKKCLTKAKMDLDQIGLFEINEAFSVVVMACMKDLNLDPKKVNIYGGAVSLGHPIGQSGTRIVVTLMNAMEQEDVEYGMASICIGGGEALAMILRKL
ncbi:MAG: acetyl-CoA C-acetyltransferase [Epsilonproteobacteria bacterium]|nr:MAG: acetyl-CoA C-acetyltransferase [Campylobacterota bacterium]